MIDRIGLAAAREWAWYYIGDESWADEIIDAYLYPSVAREKLEAEYDSGHPS